MTLARVVVSGYYGFGNAGDELILSALCHALRGHELVVLSADPARTRREHAVEAVPRGAPPAILRSLAQADLLVSGGGGLLQDATGPLTVPYYLGVITAALVLRKPVMVYAQGIGPLHSAWSRRLLAVLRAASVVTVRDVESADLLRQAGVRGLHVTADAALALPRPPSCAAVPAELAAMGVRPGEAVLAVAPRAVGDAGAIRRMAAAVDLVAGRLDARVALVAMQVPEDARVCAQVGEALRSPALVLAQPLPPARYPAVFAGFRAVLGMRLHALILGVLARVPTVGLSYDPKVDAFLRSMDRPEVSLGLSAAPEAIAARLLAEVDRPAAAAAALDRRVANLAALARRNDELLVGLLRRQR